MVVRIASRTIYAGTITPTALNTETDIVNIANQAEAYLIEGWLDVAELVSGDKLEVNEYACVDGLATYLFDKIILDGPVNKPIIRFHMKTLKNAYKVTINQKTGTLRGIDYWFIMEQLEVV